MTSIPLGCVMFPGSVQPLKCRSRERGPVAWSRIGIWHNRRGIRTRTRGVGGQYDRRWMVGSGTLGSVVKRGIWKKGWWESKCRVEVGRVETNVLWGCGAEWVSSHFHDITVPWSSSYIYSPLFTFSFLGPSFFHCPVDVSISRALSPYWVSPLAIRQAF